jgi:hypothetical protein
LFQQTYNKTVKKVNKNIQYPENLTVKNTLEWGDMVSIAAKSGKYTYGTVSEILNGRRKMPDSLLKTITEFLNERKVIKANFKKAVS